MKLMKLLLLSTMLSGPALAQFVIDKDYLKARERCLGIATGVMARNVSGQNLKQGRYLSYIKISAALFNNGCSVSDPSMRMDETHYRVLPVDVYVTHNGEVRVKAHVLEAEGLDDNYGVFDGTIVGNARILGGEIDNTFKGLNYKGIVFMDFALGFQVAEVEGGKGGIKVGFKGKWNWFPSYKIATSEFNKNITSEAELLEEIDAFNNFLDTMYAEDAVLDANAAMSIEGGAFVRFAHIKEKTKFAVEVSYTGRTSYGSGTYADLPYDFNHLRTGFTIEAEYSKRLKKGAISFLVMLRPSFKESFQITPTLPSNNRNRVGTIDVLVPREFLRIGVRYTF
jgi:hypothetical protein